ncbi:MAG TPA: GNAT family N-acetyltransferase [Rhodanobacter sp.]|nr:GNAT family N-acetyltransferase [Rhodanobacter sp.]
MTRIPDHPLIDNIFWHALSGPQAVFAVGAGAARRYAPGFSPIAGFAEPQRPDLEALRPCCAAGEPFYTDGWSGPVPDGWKLDVESTMFKMLWIGELPAADEAPEALPLRPEHAGQALALAQLTRPGPFGLRTIGLGDYFGLFDGERLMAMAGERSFAGELREVSGICTHPDYQGRGLARRLTAKLVRRELLRGETPFLHVMRGNEGARALYRRMGFVDIRESVVRVVRCD